MKVYRINRVGAPPVFKATRQGVVLWQRLNPGETLTVDLIDPVAELSEYASKLEEAENLAEGLDHRLRMIQEGD